MRWLLACLLGFAAAPLWAGVELDPAHSHISFVSLKNIDIAESHTFGRLSGTVDEDGQVSVRIDLASVDTKIPIRDQRMREHLFDTKTYPQAEIAAKIDMPWLSAAAPGRPQVLELPARLDLHGQSIEMMLHLSVTPLQGGAWRVESLGPVLLNAAVLGLEEGVRKLQEIAGLQSISLAVPVYFSLYFKAAD